MQEIPLTQKKIALVDDEDFEELNQHKWCAHKNRKMYYAERGVCRPNGTIKTIKMHREILKMLPGMMPDHVDGNGLNNQKNNLRIVTNRQNTQNRKNQIKTSRFPGVSWSKIGKKWIAQIYTNGFRKFLGYFTSEINAFNAYREAVNAIGEKVIDFSK